MSAHYWTSMLRQCEGTYYTTSSEPSARIKGVPDPYPVPYEETGRGNDFTIELRDVQFGATLVGGANYNASPAHPDLADKLNGVEWRARISWSASASRERRTDPPSSWSDWGGGPSGSLLIYKKNGVVYDLDDKALAPSVLKGFEMGPGLN